jgi:carbonic anhydrase
MVVYVILGIIWRVILSAIWLRLKRMFEKSQADARRILGRFSPESRLMCNGLCLCQIRDYKLGHPCKNPNVLDDLSPDDLLGQDAIGCSGWMTSGSNCLHLNRPETEGTRSIGPALSGQLATLPPRLDIMSMSRIVDEVLAANRAYSESFGAKGQLGMPPARRFAILTCMDARLDPAKFAGLGEGDAHVIRNAGGRASDDAIRSLVISYKLLGTREWFVIHHTDCGMETFTDEIIRGLLSRSLEQAVIDSEGWHDRGAGPGSDAGEFIDWLAIGDAHASVVTDVRRIRTHPLVPPTIPIYGYLYDVKTGALVEVPEATKIGAAAATA